MSQYSNKTRLFSRISILLLHYTSVPNTENININKYFVVEEKNLYFIQKCMLYVPLNTAIFKQECA